MENFEFCARLEPAPATDAINSTQRYRLEVGASCAELRSATRAFDFHRGHQQFLALATQPPFSCCPFARNPASTSLNNMHRIGQPLAQDDARH